MELRNIKSFIKVAELLNFSKASIALGYAQSTVSEHISQLESEFKVQLFERFGRKVKLTTEGETFLIYATKINEAVIQTENNMFHKMEPYGTLIIGATDSINNHILPNILSEFHNKFPNVNIKVKTAHMAILSDMLNRNEIDILGTLDNQIYDTKHIKVLEQITSVCFVANSAHHLFNKSSISVEDLICEDFITSEGNYGYRHELDLFFAKHNKVITPFLETLNTNFILDFVKSSNAISFLPEFVIKESLQNGSVKVLSVKNFKLEQWIQFIHLKRKWVTPQMHAFIELLKHR